MDPSRTALIAQRAGVAYRETALAKLEGDPAIALVFGEATEPAVFYRIDNVPNDLFGACRSIYWTPATAALLCSDIYEAVEVDGMPSLKDQAGLTKDDLPSLFRAGDPRVREAVQVDAMARGDKAMSISVRMPYVADGDRVEWHGNLAMDTSAPGDDEEPQLMPRLMRAAFELQASRPETVVPLDVMQCGFVAGLDTVVPDPDGGYQQLHPFGSAPAHGRAFSFPVPGGVGFALPLD